ncbi:zinc finger protein 345 [Amyelois transitella]|uniref:zinc finger protein 345 n=1 Tax=Amyelois transitella TaxID=680683 RepID=UPI0029907C38|nr:zinc finger protein 345 [Amyelois transitella]
MSDLKICRICLRTECNVYEYERFQLKYYYEEILASKIPEPDLLPHYFCYECVALLCKFHKFKRKCFTGQMVLQEMLCSGAITYQAVYEVDKKSKSLDSSLGIIMVSNRVKTYTMLETNASSDDEIYNDDTDFNHDLTEINNKEIKQVIDTNESEIQHTNVSSQLENVQIISIKSEKEDVYDATEYKFEADIKIKKLSSLYWKRINLSEEEAVTEFRACAKNPKYLKAKYQCMMCFKGFSKEEMLKRHHQSRHSETIGRMECRFCKMRFRHNCSLVKHMRAHYNKFQCLRCDLVCTLEQTALLHDEYHSGIVRKCAFCNEEFKHMSTYYSHLRTHRSEFVCTLCGVSFVSKAGLHQHKRRKHVLDEVDSPDDFEDLNTYCARCDIRFETRKAFEEHLFHSTMHTDNLGDDTEDVKKKILGKKEKAKITNALRKTNTDEDIIGISIPRKRVKKVRRLRRKPTTCYQCGQHFATQQACMKHHLAEHPGTSFYSNNERAICEICGASLAPGSIINHMNMHSREKMHPCEFCDKTFHASCSLKRHLVTHTGEKRFPCSVCGKRFTQSNSMKLHYRTVHLKQPYPKRNRRKKKEEPQSAMEDSKSEESDSMPEPEMGSMGPKPGLEPVPNVPMDCGKHMSEGNVYLTLT